MLVDVACGLLMASMWSKLKYFFPHVGRVDIEQASQNNIHRKSLSYVLATLTNFRTNYFVVIKRWLGPVQFSKFFQTFILCVIILARAPVSK